MELVFALSTAARVACLPHARRAVVGANGPAMTVCMPRPSPVWWVARFRLGEGTDEAGLARALALEDPDRARRMNVCPTFVAELIHR